MLRRQLGDPVFHQIIKTFYETYKGKNADTKDFQAVAEQASGKNLETFFQQWLYRPGNPQLEMNWKYKEADKKIIFTIKQTQQSSLYKFPLEILIQETHSSMPKKYTITISKENETFEFPVMAKPARVLADPSTSLLFESKLKEIKN
jgi:aminopeptidase N